MATITIQTVTIPSGANSVATTPPSGQSLKAIQTPAGFEGTSLTFDCGNGSPGAALYDASTKYSLTCAADRYIVLDKPTLFQGPSYLKVINNVSGSPSNVAADRVLKLYFSA